MDRFFKFVEFLEKNHLNTRDKKGRHRGHKGNPKIKDQRSKNTLTPVRVSACIYDIT